MERIWLGSYPPGVPAEADVTAYPSLARLIQTSCILHADLPAFSNFGSSLSYAELEEHARHFASYLQLVLNLKKGDRLALMLPNLLQYPVAMYGALRAGLVIVNINPLSTPAELAFQLRDSEARALVVLENFAYTTQEAMERNPDLTPQVITTRIGDLYRMPKGLIANFLVKYVKHMVPPWRIPGSKRFDHALRSGSNFPEKAVLLDAHDLAFLQYTGGTTGVPKGVMLTHGNMVANAMQMATWMQIVLNDSKEVLACPLPLYHIFALTSMMVFLRMGAHTILITNPRDIHALVQELAQHSVSAMIGVNTLYAALLNAPEFREIRLSGLKLSLAGGMAVQRKVAENWKQLTGIPIVEAYGLTEASPGAICNPANASEWAGGIGFPLPSTEARIVDDAGLELPVGSSGQICIRGPQVMKGYWKRDDETRLVLSPEGWLSTGDIGHMDEHGTFYLTDRIKDMIVVSGFKVFPSQVEEVVAALHGVSEVVAIGLPDAQAGEAVGIVVVRSDRDLTESALRLHCQRYLTAYKVPRHIEFRDAPLPKSPLGKVLRRQLREESVAATHATIQVPH